jgi:hypothetical protein
MPVTAGPIYPGIKDGLVFAIDPANKDSWAGPTSATVDSLTSYNPLSGSIINDTSGSYGDNESFTFDGVSDYIDIGVLAEMNNATKMTISYWCKKSASNKEMIIGSFQSSTNGFWLQWSNLGNVNWNPRNGSGVYRSYALTYTSNWVCLTGTYDGSLSASDRCNTYVNGVLVLEGTSTPPASFSSTAGNDFQIGGVSTFYSDGQIGPILIYNRALSAGEVLQNYNRLKGRFGLT